MLLSNADTSSMRSLYANYEIVDVTAPRNINSDVNGRDSVPELLIRD